LTATQVQTVRAANAPLRDSQKRQIDPGFPAGVRYSPVARQINIAGTLFGDWTYQDPKWDVRTFSLERDVPAARQRLPYLEFNEPDLRAFQKAGGKLITYHGWLDPTVPPGLTIQFYEAATRKLGRKARDTVRLFMAPGMDHCSRGTGPESFGQAFRGDAPVVDASHDLLTALLAWTEENRAPNRIVAARLHEGKVERTRPLCPYPQQARYKGVGSTDEAANFVCTKP
jgi:feruloyl esterase